MKFAGLISAVRAAVSATAERFAVQVRRGERSINTERRAKLLRPASAPLAEVVGIATAAGVSFRKPRRITGNPGGNAHDRRKARRRGRAFEWYLSALKARSNAA